MSPHAVLFTCGIPDRSSSTVDPAPFPTEQHKWPDQDGIAITLPACTCVGCSERGGVRTRTADRRGGEGPPTRVGTSLGNGGGSAWKWMAAIVVGVVVGAAIYLAATEPDNGQPAPGGTSPAGTETPEPAPAGRTAPSPAPDVRATTEAAIAATVEVLRATSTPGTAPLALPTKPTQTATRVPSIRPTVPSPTPTATSSPIPTTAVSFRDFKNGRWLEQEDPRLASSIKELGWMQDGIDGTEAEAIQALLYIAVTSRSVVASLVSLDWVRDGMTGDETEAIDWINNMPGAEVMSAVVALGWVRDGIDDDLEVRTIEELSYIAYDDTEARSVRRRLGLGTERH